MRGVNNKPIGGQVFMLGGREVHLYTKIPSLLCVEGTNFEVSCIVAVVGICRET